MYVLVVGRYLVFLIFLLFCFVSFCLIICIVLDVELIRFVFFNKLVIVILILNLNFGILLGIVFFWKWLMNFCLVVLVLVFEWK